MAKQHHVSNDTVPVSSFHPSPLLEAELSWFFTEAESAIALPSNLDPAYTSSRSGRVWARSVPADDSMEDRVEAAHAATVIERRLRAMPEGQAMLLFAAFDPRVWPAGLETELGRLTGIAVRLSAPRLELARSSADLRAREDAAAAVLDRALVCGGVPALAVLKWRAHVAYAGALRAYARVRGLGPTVVPAVGR